MVVFVGFRVCDWRFWGFELFVVCFYWLLALFYCCYLCLVMIVGLVW